ncbi:MAG TPA: hypothetical protein VFI15_05665 [Candidatus Limnocylindrales bacterium]|nr:hypothetical protein [Candidatus Limnocylindrales bacterium]
MGRSGLRLAGALWMIAGVVCAGLLVFVLIGERLSDLGAVLRNPGPSLLFLGGTIVALGIGVRLLTRPGPGIVRVSSAVGIAWLMIFGAVVIGPHDEPGPIYSSSLITGFGVAAGLIGFLSRPRRESP